MKLSLVICAYNEEKYIYDCVSSVIKNAPSIHEIIVVDNASTDQTASIIKSFSQTIYIHESEKWLTKARQAWYKYASGDLIAFIDADTLMPPWRYNKVIHSFQNNNNLWFLSGPYTYYDASWYSSIWNYIYWHILAYFMYLFTWYLWVWGNMIFRKTVLDKMWWFDTSIAFYSEDTNAARRAHDFAKCKYQLNLKMPTSFRRFEWQGIYSTMSAYIKAFFSEVILKKTYSEDYKDYR